MAFHCSSLMKPRGAIKFPELLIGIACILLLKFGATEYHNHVELAFITYGSSIVISTCILLVNLHVSEEDPRPYLEIVLNFVISGFYVVLSAITVPLIQTCNKDMRCNVYISSLGVLSVFNISLYTLDTYLTARLLPYCSVKKQIIF